MGINRTRMEFHNVVTYKTNAKMTDWMYPAEALKRFVLKNNLYMTGPIIVQGNLSEEGETEIKISVPINNKIIMEEAKDSKISFQDSLVVEDCLKIRHSEMDEDFDGDFEITTLIAEKLNIQIATECYFVYLPVFHDYIVDIFIPII